jgi:MFS transporter, DHA1 family, multidrug resistance protein
MRTHGRRHIAILALTLVAVMLGFGMVIPVFPFLITRLGGSGGEFGLLVAIYSIAQLAFAPLWGSLSDRHGRKPILLVGMVGNTASLVLFGLASEIWMLFAARTLSGILSCATLPAAMAYVGDCTDEKDRAAGIGQLGGALALGMILGPGLGGWLAGDSLVAPFFVAAALSLASTLLIFLFLPESLAPTDRRPGDEHVSLVNIGELREALRGPIGFLLVLAFLVAFGAMNFQAIFGLYGMQQLGLDPEQIGTVLVVVGLVSAVVQGILTGPAGRRFGEGAVIRASLLTNAIGFLVLLLATSYATVLVTTGVYVLSHALLRPSVQALTSERASGGQGAAMGLNSAFMSLGQIAGPIWAGFAFDVHPSLPYMSGAVVMLIAFVAAVRCLRTLPDSVSASSRWSPAKGRNTRRCAGAGVGVGGASVGVGDAGGVVGVAVDGAVGSGAAVVTAVGTDGDP